MFYCFVENVYFVKGKIRGCIYDLNKGRLISLNGPLSDELERMNKRGIEQNSLTDELKNVFDKFVDMGLVHLSDKAINNDINDAKAKDVGITFAWIEITSRCNLRCQHCYNSSENVIYKEMSLDDFTKVVDELVRMNVKKIQIIGGEPFLNEEKLRKALDYCLGKFSYIEVFTNGTLIPEKWYQYLAKNGIRIALSVYSYLSEQHDSVTGKKGSCVKTNDTIQHLNEWGIKYRVCNVLMKNIEIGKRNTELYKISKTKDIVRLSGRADFSLLSEELLRKKIITKNSFKRKINVPLFRSLLLGHNCFMSKLYISADLKVYPCVMERRFWHCDFSKEGKISLDDSIRLINKDSIEGCSDCEYRYACFDCRPDSIAEYKYNKPWYCSYEPETGTWTNPDEFVKTLMNENKMRQ